MKKHLSSIKVIFALLLLICFLSSGCKKDKLEISPSNINVGSDAGSGTFDITSNTSWTVSDDADWLTLNPGSGTGDASLTVTYSENNLFSSRVAIITAEASGVDPVTASVTQDMGGPQVDINWTQIADIPTPRGFLPPSAAVLDGKAYITGGTDVASDKVYDTVEVYDPVLDQWSARSSMITARWGHSADVAYGKIYVMGGCTGIGDAIRSIEVYDPLADSWSDGGIMPAANLGFASCVVNEIIYLIGGRPSEPGGDFVGDVMAYDPASKGWTTLASLPSPRGYLSVTAIGNYIYAIGGVTNGTGGGGESNIFRYDISGNSWTELTGLTYGRWSIISCAVDNIIYCIGGYTLPTDSGQKIVELVDTEHDYIVRSTDLLFKRAAGTVCVIDNKIYIFSGCNSGNPTYLSCSESEVGVITVN